jgi:CBS domain-containing protein
MATRQYPTRNDRGFIISLDTRYFLLLVRPIVKSVSPQNTKVRDRSFCALNHPRRKACVKSAGFAGTARADAAPVHLVGDHMSRPVAVITPDAALERARERLEITSCLVVTHRDGAPLGLLSRSDLLKAARLRATMAGSRRLLVMPRLSVGARMSRQLISASRRLPLWAAAAQMVNARVHRLPILDGERVVGVLSTSDVMRALLLLHVAAPLERCITAPVATVEVGEPLGVALDRMLGLGLRGLVVVDGDRPVGVFTQAEALESFERDAAAPVDEAMSEALVCLPSNTPVCDAASAALASRARRVLAVDRRRLRGIMTGMDLARLAAQFAGVFA